MLILQAWWTSTLPPFPLYCVTPRPPSCVRGSAEASLGDITKRFRLYRKFWTLLGHLGVWNHPEYLDYKHTKTSVLDSWDVMPDCVLRVSLVSFMQLTIQSVSFQEVHGQFLNPPGTPYTDFEPSSHFAVWVLIITMLRCAHVSLLYTLACS